jgi:uncharacterized iron-regulated membrane protein
MGGDVIMKFRKIVFWLHLIAGVVAGVVILIMSATGVALSFEKEIIAWAERDVRRVSPPADGSAVIELGNLNKQGAEALRPLFHSDGGEGTGRGGLSLLNVSSPQPSPRSSLAKTGRSQNVASTLLDSTPVRAGSAALPLENLLAKVREVQPDARPSGVTVYSDPKAAVLVSFNRTNVFFANPHTGELFPQSAPALRRFMQLMIEWHRYLGAQGDNRATGKAITGACNAAFLVLAVSGLYLWWPRQWSGAALRAILMFNFSLRGKARDWNWHNVIGFWAAPVLIVLTVTAMPISYRWAGDLIYKLTGTEPPTPGSGPGGAPSVEIPVPPEGTTPLSYQALIAMAKQEVPQWENITVRLGGPGGARREGQAGDSGGGPQAVTMTVKQPGSWPRTATTTLTLDPFTGAVLRREGFSDFNLGRQVRTWTRFLHTGEALGKGGQFIAGLASFGSVVLVWTGFAMAWRRFFTRKAKPAGAAPPAAATTATGPATIQPSDDREFAPPA